MTLRAELLAALKEFKEKYAAEKSERRRTGGGRLGSRDNRMANVRDIRRRIRSAKNIQQITRAMKFVSAARLRKAQDRVIAARPYARQMLAVLNSLAARVPEQIARSAGASRRMTDRTRS